MLFFRIFIGFNMLDRSTIDMLIPILRKDSKRTLKMKVRGFPSPYYCSFLLRDIEWFNTWASSGSVYRKRSDHTRNVYADIRVNSYKRDQTTNGGLFDNDDELESINHITLPIDTKCHDALRLALWRLSEAKFREALTDYSEKEAARVSTVDENGKYASFTKLPPCYDVKYSRLETLDENKWVNFCKTASKWIAELPKVSTSWVEFDTSQETKLFVSTENRIIVRHFRIFSLFAVMRNLTKEGVNIEQNLVFHVTTQKELPTAKQFKKLILEKHKQLLNLIHSKRIHSFSGPVLLAQKPAGLLFHEAIGHRLEGNRLLFSGEGQTFKGKVGQKIIEVPLDISDDPTVTRFKSRGCIGAYDFDDEGTPAAEAKLVQDGALTGFLNSRAAIPVPNNTLNGHARSRKYQRPISRMAVTIVKGKNPVTWDELKQKLIEEIRAQKKPFGMIVYETAGGETDTTKYDFQAFSGEISYATLVTKTGREYVVRGVNFVGTPLQALSSIIAVGDEQILENHYCGAESGIIPVSTISPAILIKNLELQAKNEELVTQYILPRPRL